VIPTTIRRQATTDGHIGGRPSPGGHLRWHGWRRLSICCSTGLCHHSAVVDAQDRALAATRKRHAHRLTNEAGTKFQNEARNAFQNGGTEDDSAIA
jgi:hypothetical protein